MCPSFGFTSAPIWIAKGMSANFTTSKSTKKVFIISQHRYWWRNLFYINNLFEHDDLCMNWTWSMACEMQFFLVFTIILFIYAKWVTSNFFTILFHVLKSPFKFISERNNALGIKTFVVFTFSTLVISCVLTVEHKFLPSFDVLWRTGTELYIAPWMRVTPYCVGVACGWYLNSYRKTFAVSDVSIAESLTLLNCQKFIGLIFVLRRCFAAVAKFSVLYFNVLFGAGFAQYNTAWHGLHLGSNLHISWSADDSDRG